MTSAASVREARKRVPASARKLARILAASPPASGIARRNGAAVLPLEVAQEVGLRYVADTGPGITRKWQRGRPIYFDTAGKRIHDPREIARLNALAIPPAYRDVWICPDPRGHIQATGRDARGRKQYRYHSRWREVRDATKFERMLAFGGALAGVRRQMARDLKRSGMPRERILATVLRLLETTLIRIGNEEYARANRSYGLTTLRNRHVRLKGDELRFEFRGKGGALHAVRVSDRRLAHVVRLCMDIPGQELFQYLDDEGKRHAIDSADVNAYLQNAAGVDFTAKDYRTWAGSVQALSELRAGAGADSKEAKSHLLAAIKAVAKRLGNTPTICRRCYIHPVLIEAFLADELASLPNPRKSAWLTDDEARFLAFLKVRSPGAP